MDAFIKQVLDEVRRREDLFEVIQHQHQLAISQIATQVLQQSSNPCVLQTDALGDRDRHQRRIPDVGERHEVNALCKAVQGAARQLDAQPRLAGAAGTSQRQQPVVLEKIPSSRELVLPAHEARPGSRKPTRPIRNAAGRRV